MEYTIDDGVLIVTMPERVNENNAQEIKTGLGFLVQGNQDCDMVVDCRKLRYISSSGLRGLLNAQKKTKAKKITLKNVHKEVYEILEMTGFVDIFDVHRSAPSVSIKGCEKLSESINGATYRLQKGVMVTVFRESVSHEEVDEELGLAKKALTYGIPTAISFTTAKVDGRYGIIFEDVNSLSVAQIVSKHPMKLIEYAREYARMVKEMHETEVPQGSLPGIKERYLEWLSKYEQIVSPEKWKGLKAMVQSMADSNKFVHGDLNLNNVFELDGELIVTDMASCGYGHPIFDLQALYASLVAIELDNPGYCEKTFGVTAKNCRRFWKVFIRTYLGANEDDSVEEKRMNQLLTQYYILKEDLLNGMANLT